MVSASLLQFTPSTRPSPAISEWVVPTPMIDPIKVCELDAGSPRYQVPTFQTIAEPSRANTMAKLAPEPAPTTRSAGSRLTMPNATAPLDTKTPAKFHRPDHTTATVGRS